MRPSPNRKYLFKARSLGSWLPVRAAADNKSRGGRALILAGQKQMPGAAILAAQAASRIGAGYVYISEPEVLHYFPEAIPLGDRAWTQMNAILIGPGLGIGISTKDKIKKLKKTSLPVVIDADALTVSANYNLWPFPKHWIATPHEAELGRLLGISADQVRADRLGAAQAAQKKLDCLVLLKGHPNLIVTATKSIELRCGNVALAKGGSGDVLAGMITGLLAQQVSPPRAIVLAVYLHGKIADDWVNLGRDYLSLTPSDLLAQLPSALTDLRWANRP